MPTHHYMVQFVDDNGDPIEWFAEAADPRQAAELVLAELDMTTVLEDVRSGVTVWVLPALTGAPRALSYSHEGPLNLELALQVGKLVMV